jgi:hypothetical protein
VVVDNVDLGSLDNIVAEMWSYLVEGMWMVLMLMMVVVLGNVDLVTLDNTEEELEWLVALGIEDP